MKNIFLMMTLALMTMYKLTVTAAAAEVKRTASMDAQMQKDNTDMATRVLEGTKITITVGNVVIPATLNDCRTSQELIARMPCTVSLRRYSHDYCGVIEPLSYDESDEHYGWLNGDIDFAIDGNCFTILFEDEDNSEQYGHQINLGKVDCPLSVVKGLGDSVEMRLELARQ